MLRLLLSWLPLLRSWPISTGPASGGYPVTPQRRTGAAAIKRAARHARNRQRSRR